MRPRPTSQRLLWPALAELGGLAAAVPLWTSHFLPFQDAPQHLAAISLLSDQSPAADESRRWFTVGFAHAQYAGFYVPAAWLASFIGSDAAIRVLLSVVAVLLPASAWLFLKSFGRDPRLAVFAPALFHTAPLYIGVYHFVAAVPVALAAIALVERELRQPARWRPFAIALLALALVVLHSSGLAIASGAAIALAWTARAPRDHKLRALAPLAPAAVWLAIWTRAPTTRPVGTLAAQGPAGPSWQSPLAQLHDLVRFANVIPGRTDELFVVLLVSIWIALRRSPGEKQSPERSWRLPMLAAGLFCAYMVAPVDIGYVAYIHLRAIPFLVAFAMFSLVIARTPRTGALLAAVVALQVAWSARLVETYRSFDREVQQGHLEEVLRAAEPGRRVVALMLNRRSRVVHFEPYMHFGLYYQIERGGRVRFNFGELPWMPVRFRKDQPLQRFPLNWEFYPGFFDWKQARSDADYVLVRSPDPQGSPAEDPEPGPDFAAGWELLKRAGQWAMFRPAPR